MHDRQMLTVSTPETHLHNTICSRAGTPNPRKKELRPFVSDSTSHLICVVPQGISMLVSVQWKIGNVHVEFVGQWIDVDKLASDDWLAWISYLMSMAPAYHRCCCGGGNAGPQQHSQSYQHPPQNSVGCRCAEIRIVSTWSRQQIFY